MQSETTSPCECQLSCIISVAEGNAKSPPISLNRYIKLAVRRRLTPMQDRMLHSKVNSFLDLLDRMLGKKSSAIAAAYEIRTGPLKAGDLVRVKSRDEIEATLNHLGQSRGCAFMADAMTPYCNTIQKVLKPMERFVDERDLRVKKCKGLILLEGVLCQGTAIFGRCDRSCHMFWREEWLEKIE